MTWAWWPGRRPAAATNFGSRSTQAGQCGEKKPTRVGAAKLPRDTGTPSAVAAEKSLTRSPAAVMTPTSPAPDDLDSSFVCSRSLRITPSVNSRLSSVNALSAVVQPTRMGISAPVSGVPADVGGADAVAVTGPPLRVRVDARAVAQRAPPVLVRCAVTG